MFLLLAANYESLVLPFAVILIVPMCLLAAIVGVNLMGLDNNILTQIGLVVLIGLAAKNAILIVEFAKQNEDAGMELREAAEHAAAQRLRPILMTSIAFILGTLPLVIGSGPGSELRRALGVAVFFGMIGVTTFGLLFTPSFYVISRKLGDRASAWANRRRKTAPGGDPAARRAAGGGKAMKPVLPVLVAALALSGCVVGPDYKRPSTPDVAAGKLAETARLQSAANAATLPDHWWRLYDDPVLDRLITDALAHNTDIRVAAANLARARAVLSEQRGARLPSTNLTGSYARQQANSASSAAFGGTGTTTTAGPKTFQFDLFKLGFDASYELDLFGGITRAIEAGRGDVAASVAQLDAARVSVAAETASAYAGACSNAAQLAVARDTVDLQAKTLKLTRTLFDGGGAAPSAMSSVPTCCSRKPRRNCRASTPNSAPRSTRLRR